jgi:hypothetical protein
MAGILSVQVPYYLQAKNLDYCIIQGGQPNAAGTLHQWSTPLDIGSKTGNGTFETIEWEMISETSSFRPSDMTIEVMLKEFNSFNCTVNEQMSSANAGPLTTIAGNYDVARVEARYLPAGAPLANAIYVVFAGTISRLTGGIKPGKNVASIQLLPIGRYPYIGLGPSLPF